MRTQEQTQHTPLPWVHVPCTLLIAAPQDARRGDDRHSWAGFPIASLAGAGKEDERAEREANAAFIVQACNAHADLVATLESAEVLANDVANLLTDLTNGEEPGRAALQDYAARLAGLGRCVNAALAKARGE